MTYEEALNEINQECVICRTSNSCAKDECIWYICKKAIDKQIPKPMVDNTDYEWFECPTCGRILIPYYAGKRDHCRCGQAISWEEEDDI